MFRRKVFEEGERVEHPVYGTGTVKRLSEYSRRFVVVIFDHSMLGRAGRGYPVHSSGLRRVEDE